jgi:hypothetical protein
MRKKLHRNKYFIGHLNVDKNNFITVYKNSNSK